MRPKADLSRLLRPRAVAVVGATAKSGKVGRIIFETLLRAERPVYPVHPTEATILGRQAFKQVSELPAEVDVAVIATGAERATEAAEACAAHGIPFIIPVAGGFAEVGGSGAALEDRLRKLLETTATRILGPNTLGLFVPQERLDTIFVEHGDHVLAQGGGVAFITQSGSVGVEALGLESNIGFGLRAFVGLGNKVDLDEVDFMQHFADDERTTCVALYVEALPNGHEFLEAAGKLARRKPVVVLKAGRTPTAAAAASSHTGRLAGSDRVVSGAFRQFGIQRVFDEEQLCDAARVLAVTRPPEGRRVGIVSPAGGYGVMATDYVEAADPIVPLAMAKLAPETETRLGAVAPAFASLHNPVDLTASATDAMTVDAVRAVAEDPGVDIVLCVALFAPPGITDGLIRAICGLQPELTKPLILVAQFGPFTNGHLSRFHDHGVIGFPSIARAVRAVRWLVERHQISSRHRGAP
ncbi:MAG: CoA-binding protein [Deltaproteobacteria bacterium]|nr:CoA-binding protein [Deltaproteobacteria bacterium]